MSFEVRQTAYDCTRSIRKKPHAHQLHDIPLPEKSSQRSLRDSLLRFFDPPSRRGWNDHPAPGAGVATQAERPELGLNLPMGIRPGCARSGHPTAAKHDFQMRGWKDGVIMERLWRASRRRSSCRERR